MRYEKRLMAEINAVLDRLANERQPMVARWVTQEVCDKHMLALTDGDSKAFWMFCGYETVRDKVRRAINRRAGDDKKGVAAEQFVLPGYNHVHEYYLVKRNGEEQAVHIDNMTAAEIKGRAEIYRSMGRSCFEHANELDRYVQKRRRKSA